MALKHLAVGWNVASGLRIGKWFSTSRGQLVFRVAGALFHRFGLEVEQQLKDGDRPGGAWFFESDGTTVSELKWKIWSAIAIHLLECPVPDATINFLIASDYFWRHLPLDPAGREACRDFKFWVSTEGGHVAVKVAKVLGREMVDTRSEEEIVTCLEKVVERLPSSHLPQTRLSDAVRLFNTTMLVHDLVMAWLLFQLGGNKRSYEWLVSLENQAIPSDSDSWDDLGKLVFFFLQLVCSKFHPPDVSTTLANVQVVSENTPKIEWKGIDLAAGVRQLLQELLEAQAKGCLVYGDHESLKHWILNHSQVYNVVFNLVRSQAVEFSDKSVLIGRLLYSWSRTSKGQRDLEELKQLCNVTVSDVNFVTHAKSTVRNKSSSEGECAALYAAAATVFGDKFSGRFVTLCVYAAWGYRNTAVCLTDEELEEVKGMVRRGIFSVANPLPDSNWLGDMVLYLVHLVLEDRIQCFNDRQTWIEDAQELLVSFPRLDIDVVSAAEAAYGDGILFTENWTPSSCREFEAWLYSPNTAKEMEASVDEMNSMMKKAVFEARDDNEAGKRLVAKMARLCGTDENDMYGRVVVYVRHGLEDATKRDDHSFELCADLKRKREECLKLDIPVTTPLMQRLEKEKRCKAMNKRQCCAQTKSSNIASTGTLSP